MNKEKREQNPKSCKLPQFHKHGKTAEAEGQKGTNGGKNSHQSHSTYLGGRIAAPGCMGTIQKQQVGDTVIHGYGNNCAAKSQHNNGDCTVKKGVDKQGNSCSGQGRDQREQTDKRPGKGEQQQQSNTCHGQNYGHTHVPSDNGFVVQCRPVSTHRRKGHLHTLGCIFL